MSANILCEEIAKGSTNPVITTIITAIIMGVVAYIFGFNQYIRQRKREEIRKTYVEGGIGKVMQITENISMACYSNYGKVITTINILCLSEKNKIIERKIIDKLFLEMHDVKVAPEYGNLKLAIFGGKKLIGAVVKSWAEYQTLNDYLRHYTFQEFEIYLTMSNLTLKEKKKFLAEFKKQIREKWHLVVDKYEPLREQLLLLQVEIDKANVTNMEEIDNISKRENVIKIVKKIEDNYMSNDIDILNQ